MLCKKPIILQKNLDPVKFPLGLKLPCGQCLQCRISRRREWSLRLTHELHYWQKSMFLTLTYDDKHMPDNQSLRKDHLQKFMKKLRKNLDHPIKYFAVGEYGSKTFRPHYHAILYGLGLNELDKSIIKSSWSHCNWNQPTIAKKSFGLVEKDSIQYVAGYIHDKLYGQELKFMYHDTNRENVFKLSSLGLGARYCDEFAEQIRKDKFITLNGIKYSIPRYYLKRLNFTTEEIEQIQSKALEENIKHIFNLTGQMMTEDELYILENSSVVRSVDTAFRRSSIQHNKNLQSKLNLKHRDF